MVSSIVNIQRRNLRLGEAAFHSRSCGAVSKILPELCIDSLITSANYMPGMALGAEDVSGNNQRAGPHGDEIPGRETDREHVDI